MTLAEAMMYRGANTQPSPIPSAGDAGMGFKDYLGSTAGSGVAFQPPQDGGFTGGKTPGPAGGENWLPNGGIGMPSGDAPFAQAGGSFDEQLRQLYRTHLGREATQQEIDGHRNNPEGLAGVFKQMQQDPSFRDANAGINQASTSQTFGTSTTDLPNAGRNVGVPKVMPFGLKLPAGLAAAAGAGARAVTSGMFGAKPSWIQTGTVGASAENPWAKMAGGASAAASKVAGGSMPAMPSTQSSYGTKATTTAEPASYDDWMNTRLRGL